MNYLAHLALSGGDPDMRVGGFLGDWLKGPLENHKPHWSPAVIRGVLLHRKIDVWIDQQPATLKAMQLLGPKFRRMSGPVIDIVFDHFLARYFNDFYSQPLPVFSDECFAMLNKQKHKMPDGAQRFLSRAQRNQLFVGYADQDILLGVVNSLQSRISKPEMLDGIDEAIVNSYQQIESVFFELYPLLLNQSAAMSQQLREK